MSKYLKTTSVFLVLLFTTIQGISQDTIKKALQGEWIKDRISLKDGSTIYDDNLLNSSSKKKKISFIKKNLSLYKRNGMLAGLTISTV